MPNSANVCHHYNVMNLLPISDWMLSFHQFSQFFSLNAWDNGKPATWITGRSMFETKFLLLLLHSLDSTLKSIIMYYVLTSKPFFDRLCTLYITYYVTYPKCIYILHSKHMQVLMIVDGSCLLFYGQKTK